MDTLGYCNCVGPEGDSAGGPRLITGAVEKQKGFSCGQQKRSQRDSKLKEDSL